MQYKIGFIGQGWIGKNYADDFENRGFEVCRYSLEEPYINNKEAIKGCDIVFIAVPTPTVAAKGFDDSIVREAIKLVGKGKIAVIKSTILPGTTESIAQENPDIIVVHSPEFLREASAAYDAANPVRNIIGLPLESEECKESAKKVMEVLPKAPYELICRAKEAELVKYGGNCFLYSKVIFANLLYDLVSSLGCDWQLVRDSVAADPRIGSSHFEPISQNGRGAGGGCFIKDFEAFRAMYEKIVGDETGIEVLDSMRDKNIKLLKDSGKSIDLLKGVYGEDVIK